MERQYAYGPGIDDVLVLFDKDGENGIMSPIFRMRVQPRLVSVVFLAGFLGCGLRPLTKGGLAAAERKWAEANITSYRMAVDIEMFSLRGGYFEVVVEDGEVVEARNANVLGELMECRIDMADHVTVQEMFGVCRFLLEEMVRHEFSTEEFSVRVKFDPRYGFLREALVSEPTVGHGINQHWVVKSFKIIRTGPDEKRPAAVRPEPWYDTVDMQMQQLRVACEHYAGIHGQYPFSAQGSDEALRLAIRTAESLRPEFPSERLDSWLQYRGTGAPGEVEFLYLNDPDVGRLPPDTIMLVEKSPIRPDGRLYVAPGLGDGPIAGQVYLIDSGGLSPAEVLGRRLSDFSVSRVFPPEEYRDYVAAQMEALRGLCEYYARREGQYPFSAQGSDEALRLAIRTARSLGPDFPSEKLDHWLQYRRTGAPGEVEFLYLNVPDAGRLPVGTIMLVEKSPIRPDGRLYVAPRLGRISIISDRYVYLIDTGGLSPAEVLGRNLSEFRSSPAP